MFLTQAALAAMNKSYMDQAAMAQKESAAASFASNSATLSLANRIKDDAQAAAIKAIDNARAAITSVDAVKADAAAQVAAAQDAIKAATEKLATFDSEVKRIQQSANDQVNAKIAEVQALATDINAKLAAEYERGLAFAREKVKQMSYTTYGGNMNKVMIVRHITPNF